MTTEKRMVAGIAVLIAYVIIAYFAKWWPFNNNSNNERSSKPRCKCGTANCNDSNCDPGVERIIRAEEVAQTRTIPLEMPPSRR